MKLAEALSVDLRGDYDCPQNRELRGDIRQAMFEAWEPEPQNLELAARLFNHLVASEPLWEFHRAHSFYAQVIDSQPASADLIERFVAPCALVWIEEAEMDQARTALNALPYHVAHQAPSWKATHWLLRARELVLADRQVVPWSRLLGEWWRYPLELPAQWQGRALVSWMGAAPLRMHGQDVVLRVGGTGSDGRLRFRNLRVPEKRWLQIGGQPVDEGQIRQAATQQFYEIGVYGKQMRAMALEPEANPLVFASPGLNRWRALEY